MIIFVAIISYFFIGLAVARLVRKSKIAPNDDAMMLLLFWPLMAVVFFCIKLTEWVEKVVDEEWKLPSFKNKKEKGFALIELMIVIAIIGIVVAIAIPNYQEFQKKKKCIESNNWSGECSEYRQVSYETSDKGYASKALEIIIEQCKSACPNGIKSMDLNGKMCECK